MGASKSQAWIIGTTFVAVLILVATWLLLVSPKRTEIQDAEDANASALSQQDQLRHQLTVLESQYQQLDEFQADLDAIAAQIPAEAKLPDYVRSLATVATQTGVTIVELSPGVAVDYAELVSAAAVTAPVPVEKPETTDPVATAEDTADTAEETSADAAGGETVDPPVAPAPAGAAFEGMAAIPVTMIVLGTYPNVNAYLDAVQTQVGRLFLVTGFDAARQDAADNSGTGRPSTAPGDVQMTITGFLWEFIDPGTTVPEVPADGEEPTAPAPLPSTDRNPFASITGAV